MTISRTSSRKSAPNFTSKRQRQALKRVRNLDPKRVRVRAPKKEQANVAKETSSTRSSKSSTKTRKNKRKTICQRRFETNGRWHNQKNQKEENKTYGSSQCETARRSGAGASD